MDLNNNQNNNYDPMEKYRNWMQSREEEKPQNEVQKTSVFADYSQSETTEKINDNKDIIELSEEEMRTIASVKSYEEWKKSAQDDKEQYAKKKNPAKAILAGVLAASILFGAGVFTSSYINGNDSEHMASDEITNTPNSSTTTLDLSETPTTTYTTSSGVPLSGSQIYEKVSPSVVGISSQSFSAESGTGSGIILSADGYIITNNHVVEGGDVITVYLHDDTSYKAEVIGLDAQSDLAVLKIQPEQPLVPAEFGNPDSANVGDHAYAIGSPAGLELQNTFTGGYISAISRDVLIDDQIMTLIQTDVAINPGNSGGPLINEYGQVIGVNTVKLSATYYEGLGFAIPIDDAKEIIDELIENGEITGRPAIGISGYEITQSMSAQTDMPMGLYVSEVDSRSDAYEKGLKEGDVVVGVNGTETPTMAEVNKIKEEFRAGDEITLNIIRNGQELDITIELMDQEVMNAQPEVEEQQIPQNQIPEYLIPFLIP